MLRKTVCVLTFSCLVFFAGIGTEAAEEIDKNFHQSFDVKEGDSLSLRLGRNRDFDVEFRQTANTIYVIGKEPSSVAVGFYNKRVYEYVYEIHSPAYVALELDGDDGNVGIENWTAEIECRIDDRDIVMAKIEAGGLNIRTADGDVTLRESL